MKYTTTILLAALLVMMIPAGALQAEDGEREGERKVERKREGEGERKREGDRRREGEGERKREGDRKREGEGERKREGDRKREGAARGIAGEGERGAANDRRDEMGQLRKILSEIAVRLAKMERELAELRRVNANLRRQLGRPARAARAAGEGERRREGEGERRREVDGNRRREIDGERRREGEGERAAGGLPQGIRGFRGILEGTIVRKGERGFVLKVTKTGKTWAKNKAKNPREAIGKEIEILIRADRPLTDRGHKRFKEHLEVLGGLKAGDRVSVEAFHFGGNHLVVVEALKKIS